jgi:hypothetical protein
MSKKICRRTIRRTVKPHAPAYTRKEIARLRELGMKYPMSKWSKVLDVSHITPRAYCVAKPAACMAVFAIPPSDNEPQVGSDAFTTVHGSSASSVKLGDWCALAYLSTSTCGEPVVLETLTPPAR